MTGGPRGTLPADPRSMNAFILTGGKSGRMGREKALLTLGDRSFIDILAGTAAGLFNRVYTVGRGYGNRLIAGNIEDCVSGAGPLGGILAALRRNDREWGFFVAVDYPLVDPGFLSALARFTADGEAENDAVVPAAPDGLHPLLAFYTKRCIPAVERCLQEGRFRIAHVYPNVRTRFVKIPEEIPGLGPEGVARNFANVNDERDYERVKKIAKKL